MSQPTKHRTRDEINEFLKERAKAPLYTHRIEFEGMSLSFVNPAFIGSAGAVADKGKAGDEPVRKAPPGGQDRRPEHQ